MEGQCSFEGSGRTESGEGGTGYGYRAEYSEFPLGKQHSDRLYDVCRVTEKNVGKVMGYGKI